MSQAGEIDVVGTHPEIPTEFIANVGTAVPIANQLEVLGEVVAAGTNPFRSIASGNTVTYQAQITQAIAATDATKIGLASFNSDEFIVDSNGFVSLSGSGAGETITGTTGGALSPTAGNWNILAGVVAAGTVPIQTNGAVSTLTINVQTSQAIAAADATKLGLSNFDSSSFSVSGTGFVTLATTGAGKTITGNSGGALSPTANNWNIFGTSTAAGTSPVNTSGSGSTLTVNVQTSQALAAADATKIGLSNFDSSSFSVTATGFVTLSTTGSGKTITGDTGGALSPTANNWNILGSGSITTAGSGSTLTVQLTGLTNHSVLVGAGTTTITKVAPSATSGVPLISQGASADPLFGTAVVAGGGTGSTSFNINGAVYSNTTTTGALQAATLTSGQLLIGGTTTPAAATLTQGTGISITNGNNSITIAVNGAVVGQTITGDTGGALSPTAGNWNILGSGSITTSGSGSTLTTQLTGLTNHAVLVGAGTTTITKIAATANTGAVLQNNSGADPSYSTATYPSTTTVSQILYSSATNTVSGLATANRGVLTTGATGIPVITALATDGQLIIGSTAGAPAAATLTAGTGISITNGSNSITIAVASGTAVVQTLTGNTGGAISPTAGNINTVGTGSITIAGSGSTLTTQLTGLTNHAIQIGAGTATLTQLGPTATAGQILQSAGSSADPAFSTATYPSTTTVSQILYSSATNVVSGLATANSAVLVTNSTGVPSLSGTMTNGQLIIGSTGATPTAATLTAGTGVTITNAAASITISTTGAGLTWSDTSGTVTAAINNGYFITTTCTSTLPADGTAIEGSIVAYVVDTTNLLTITANTGQTIRIGTTISASAGTAVNTQRGDSIMLVYRASPKTWFAIGSPVGGWNVT